MKPSPGDTPKFASCTRIATSKCSGHSTGVSAGANAISASWPRPSAPMITSA